MLLRVVHCGRVYNNMESAVFIDVNTAEAVEKLEQQSFTIKEKKVSKRGKNNILSNLFLTPLIVLSIQLKQTISFKLFPDKKSITAFLTFTETGHQELIKNTMNNLNMSLKNAMEHIDVKISYVQDLSLIHI